MVKEYDPAPHDTPSQAPCHDCRARINPAQARRTFDEYDVPLCPKCAANRDAEIAAGNIVPPGHKDPDRPGAKPAKYELYQEDPRYGPIYQMPADDPLPLGAMGQGFHRPVPGGPSYQLFRFPTGQPPEEEPEDLAWTPGALDLELLHAVSAEAGLTILELKRLCFQVTEAFQAAVEEIRNITRGLYEQTQLPSEALAQVMRDSRMEPHEAGEILRILATLPEQDLDEEERPWAQGPQFWTDKPQTYDQELQRGSDDQEEQDDHAEEDQDLKPDQAGLDPGQEEDALAGLEGTGFSVDNLAHSLAPEPEAGAEGQEDGDKPPQKRHKKQKKPTV